MLGLAEMMNFPAVITGRSRGAREARPRRRRARRRPRSRRPRQGAPGLRGGRHPLGPRGADGRGGPRAAPRGHVAAHPGGVDGPEPARPTSARAGARTRPHRVLHRRPRPGGHRGRRSRQRDGAQGGRCGNRARGCTRHGIAPPRALARPPGARRDRTRVPGRPPRPARPRLVRAGARAEARTPDRGPRARRDPGVGASERPHQAGDRGRLRHQRRRAGASARSASSPTRW